MSLVLGVEILGEFKNLTAATKGAQSQLTQMNKRAQSVSKAITGAFAAIGVGFSLRIITQQLEEASKAAIEDTKSQKLLALAMENTANATKAQIAQAEKSINRMQFQAGVADDQLRPAFQKLFIATKDVTQSNRLLQIALDASAATGKSLDAVSQAMAKSLAGSDTALVKLIPSLKGAKDPMAELEKTFKGAATEAANIDPYQKMQVIFGELQEQIGMALLPSLNKFSAWLSTPEGTAKMQAIIDLAIGMIDKFQILTDWVLKNKDAIIAFSGVLAGAVVTFKLITTAITVYNTVMAASAIATGALTASLGPLAAALGTVLTLWTAYQNIQAGGGVLTSVPSGSAGNTFLESTASPSAGGSNMTFKTPAKTAAKAPVTIVNNIKATQSAAQISATLNKQLKASGSSTIIRGGR
jgi:hypothetical protein